MRASVVLLCGLAMPCATMSDETVSDEAAMIIEAFDREIAVIKKKAEDDVRAAHEKRLVQLEQLQDKYTKAGKLDEAVAVRDKIRALKLGGAVPASDPGTLELYKETIGAVYYFDVIGATGGRVYGTDIYTSDSHLATASVHCGTLKYGEKGVVKVTIMPGRASYEGSERHGVSSSQWTTWGASFKIEPLKPANTEKTENK